MQFDIKDDHSRVKLVTVDDEDCDYTDYINANFVAGLKSHTKYIACQGPLKHTIDDFWSMVWEQKVSIIVMLTQVKEGLRVKCDTYWPEKIKSIKVYGDIKVTLLSANPNPDFVIRKFRLESGVIKQYVRQYQYLTWPDRKFPRTDILYDFMATIRQNSTKLDNRGPVVVHCSAGVGRTGTFIGIENIIEKIHKNMPIDVFNTVLDLRKNRINMVQNQFQYRFIYDMIYYYYQKSILKRDDTKKVAEKRERTDSICEKLDSVGEKLESVEMKVF
jgi:protein tyrosine phosphatase